MDWTLLGIILSVLQLFAGILALSFSNRWKYVYIGLLAVFVGLSIWVIKQIPQAQVVITDPPSVAVGSKIKVCGTVNNKPSSKNLYVVVHTDKYYSFETVATGGHWESSGQVDIGAQKAELLFLLVPRNSKEEDIMKVSMQKPIGKQGLEFLPYGVEEIGTKDINRTLPNDTSTCTSSSNA